MKKIAVGCLLAAGILVFSGCGDSHSDSGKSQADNGNLQADCGQSHTKIVEEWVATMLSRDQEKIKKFYDKCVDPGLSMGALIPLTGAKLISNLDEGESATVGLIESVKKNGKIISSIKASAKKGDSDVFFIVEEKNGDCKIISASPYKSSVSNYFPHEK
jgi:PBP1b-binding outer membrane lipoprotein LpoB